MISVLRKQCFPQYLVYKPKSFFNTELDSVDLMNKGLLNYTSWKIVTFIPLSFK